MKTLAWLVGILFLALATSACSALPVPFPAPAAKSAPTAAAAIPTDGRTKGNPKAPITLVVFSDFQWPYCKDFAVDAARRIEEEYVKTGKVKLVYKYFPILDAAQDDAESTWAAIAAECANEQGKFWEYHDWLFVKWLGENVGMYSPPQLKKFAVALKLDADKFNTCFDSFKYVDQIQADYDEAIKLGARGTPTFLMNDKPLQVRSLEFSEFAQAFDSLLK